MELSAQLQSRVINLMAKSALGVVESTQGNGSEAWRLLLQTFGPVTDARFASLVISAVGYKVAKNADVQASLVTWEGAVLRLEKDHKEKLSDKIKRALLFNILPATIQSRVYEHLDRLTTYDKVRGKVISLVQVAKGPGDVDCGSLNVDADEQWPDYTNWWPDKEETDIGAFTPETQCFRCGGKGHISTTCGTA